MREAGIGRVLVASLHQGIADILPMRLTFYENWLNAEGLREGWNGVRSGGPPLGLAYGLSLRPAGSVGGPVRDRIAEVPADYSLK